MPFLKFKCDKCQYVFDELVRLDDVEKLTCPKCGAAVKRAYEGKCLGSTKGDCGGNCSCCGGCGNH